MTREVREFRQAVLEKMIELDDRIVRADRGGLVITERRRTQSIELPLVIEDQYWSDSRDLVAAARFLWPSADAVTGVARLFLVYLDEALAIEPSRDDVVHLLADDFQIGP